MASSGVAGRAEPGRSLRRAAIVAAALLAATSSARAEPVAVEHLEGLAHGFVAVHALDGAPLGDGDLIETTVSTPGGHRVTARLTLRFGDGSIHEETTIYLQQKAFRLVSNHVVQQGPAFKMPMESTITANGRVRVRYTDEDGEEKTLDERMELPPDVANGMILALLKNISPRTPKTTVSMVAFTPKPRLVQLELSPAGSDPFSTAATARKATHYVVKVHVPGLAGAVASVLGKIPPDSHVWVLGGEAPAFVKAELALSPGGPIWRLELLSPVWSHGSASTSGDGGTTPRRAAARTEARRGKPGGRTGADERGQ